MDRSVASRRLLPAALAVLCYGATARFSDFIQDDRYLIAENPLLRAPDGALRAWLSGYWQTVVGKGTTVFEYRPLVMFTFIVQKALGGGAGAMHAGNVLLHAAVCVVLGLLLRRFLSERAAWIACLFFAVLPVHAEAVAALVDRSEMLAALWMLAAWLLLDGAPGPRAVAFGALAYALALLSKEHAALFPAVLALSDWTFHAQTPWSRRRVHAALAATAAAYLLLRGHVLGRLFQGGESYFAGTAFLPKVLTVARFAVERYVWPTATGLGLANDFSRPLIPDSGLGDVWAWACLLALAAALAAAAVAAARRRAWGFWALLPFLLLLPTSNLIVPLNAIGAQRFVYFPSIAAAVGLGVAFDRLLAGRRAVWVPCAGLLVVFGVLSARRSAVWSSRKAYYEDAVAFNPVSSGARLGRGMTLWEDGDREAARRDLEAAARLDPRSAAPAFNLGKMAWEAGDAAGAERLFQEATAADPGFVPARDFLALAAEKRGAWAEAEAGYRSVLALQPSDPIATFNLGLMLWRRGRAPEAVPYLRRFVAENPDDPDAARIRTLLPP